MRYGIVLAVCAVALTACAPRVQLPGPLADEPHLNREALVTADGARLPVRRWMPDGRPKAVILALHGFNDYSNAFALPAAYWRERGIATYAYDQRGFGAAPHPGVWPGTRTLVADLEAMVRLVRRRHPGVPLYVLGESMGGGVVLAAMGDPAFPRIDGTILAAPAVWGRATMPIPYRVALWLGAHTVPWLRVTGRGLDRVPTDNVEMLKAMSRDPLVLKDSRIDALYGVVNLMDAALAAAPKVHTPVLVLYGEKDQIIPKEPTRELVERLPRSLCRVALYEKGYHMLLRDLEAETVYHDVVAWIADHSAQLPSGADRRDLRVLAGD